MYPEQTVPAPPRSPARRRPAICNESAFTDDMRLVGRKLAKEEKFRQRFDKEIPEEEELINYYSCAYNKDYYLQHGALYVTSNFICFRSNIFGQERKFVIPTADVERVHKVNTFRLIPSGIVIQTSTEKYNFESFLNRNSAYETLKTVSRKHNIDPLPHVKIAALRQDGKLSAKRFIKSQSSCSLERMEKSADTKEDFLRPLSATVMAEYVTRRMSIAAQAINIQSPHPSLSDQQQEPADSVDGGFVHKDESSQMDKVPLIPSDMDGFGFQWHTSANKNPILNVRISMNCLIRLGYFACFLLTLSAVINLTHIIFSARPSKSVTRFTGTEDFHLGMLNHIDLYPLHDTLALLGSVCNATHKLIQQVTPVLL